MAGSWLDGEMLYGSGLINDKAQLCAEMIAARAIKKAGARLEGDHLADLPLRKQDVPAQGHLPDPMLQPFRQLEVDVDAAAGGRFGERFDCALDALAWRVQRLGKRADFLRLFGHEEQALDDGWELVRRRPSA